jgi:N-glycosylase/DNA lyase
MKELLDKALQLQKGKIGQDVRSKIDHFASFKDKSDEEWFSELCFCLLTANSKASTACKIQADLGGKGFLKKSPEFICKTIQKHKHRFHNNKTKFIVEARKHHKIKETVQSQLTKPKKLREWLVNNIKGYGYKEASHFLRNTGYLDFAILDRHILNLMLEHKVIRKKPTTLNKKKYTYIESRFKMLAKKVNMSCAELDYYMWYMKAGEVLK